jgi:hypothetical protein
MKKSLLEFISFVHFSEQKKSEKTGEEREERRNQHAKPCPPQNRKPSRQRKPSIVYA